MDVGPRALALTLLWLAASVAFAQEMPEFPGPAPEHELLKRFVGRWETVGSCDDGPGAEPMTHRGVIEGRMIGERWVENRHRIDAGGLEVIGVQTLGYDPLTERYVGSWVDTMQNHFWVYEGAYDEATRTLVLEAEGPNLMGDGETTTFRDSYRFTEAGTIVSTSEALGADGEWAAFMSGEAIRAEE